MSEKDALLPSLEHDSRSCKRRTGSNLPRKRFLPTLAVIALLLTNVFVISVSPGRHYLGQLFHRCKNYGKNITNPKLSAPADGVDDLCLTPACIHAASELLYNLAPEYQSLDPCDNFEEMVCGGWRERHDLRPDQGDSFEGTMMAETAQTLLRHILEGEYPRTSTHSHYSPARLESSAGDIDKQNFEKLKDAFDACLDEDAIKKAGIAPLLHIFDELSKHKTTPGAVLYLAKLGVTALVASGADADAKDPDTVVVEVSCPGSIGLPAKEYYSDKKAVKKYTGVITEVFSALKLHGSDIEVVSSLAKDLVDFEKKLAAASPDEEDLGDITKTYNPMSLSEADKLSPQIHLSQLIHSLAPMGTSIKRVIVDTPQYLKDLKEILSHTSKKTLELYFQWKVIQSFAADIEAEELKPYQAYVKELQGKDPKSTTERWRTCLTHVDDGLGWLLSRFYIEKAFSAEAKALGDEIILDIKDRFAEKLKVIEWMEDEVRELAIQKVHNIVQKIGYPTKSPDLTDPIDLQKYYEAVKITASNHFQNVMSLRDFDVHSEWSKLGKPVDRNLWFMTADTVNAYYNPPGNEIVFPAAIMQFPVFSAAVPQYLSYGAFGSVAGHELSHAFDNTGRHFDQNGNYTDWWTDKTVKAFDARAECFISEYNNFTIEGPTAGSRIHVNGKLTLGENIADAGGLTASFAAWKNRAAKSPIDANLNLPGLEFFTHEQLFFVNYANWWCGKSTKQAAIQRIYVDPHAPKWARVIGGMQNSRDFKEAFNCPVKKPTCELW